MAENSRQFLDIAFHPKSIAIVGASAEEKTVSWVKRLLDFGYPGTLYPVNPKVAEINGLKAYPSVRDIPGPVDYAIFSISARRAPQAMEDCVSKGVKIVHIYTAGFSETGREEGRQLEKRVAAIAKEGGVRVMGPNGMGIYYPAGGLTYGIGPHFPKEAGNVSVVSQTGTGIGRLVFLAHERGIHFNKAVSYGNALDLDAADFLEYLAEDAGSKIVVCYVEGVKDGRRFLHALKKCLAVKPVILLKAGLTEGGSGAAASHTGSLGGSAVTWDAVFKQTEPIRAYTVEEILDIIMALTYLPRLNGKRVGIIGRGGGIGVMAADSCEQAGLQVPPFLTETRNQLMQFLPEAGAGSRNPVETPFGMSGAADFMTNGLKIVDADPQIDIILINLALDLYGGRHPGLKGEVDTVAKALLETRPSLSKPVVAVIYAGENLEIISAAHEGRRLLVKAGVPVFSDIGDAANAIYKVIEYYSSRSNGLVT